MEKHRNLCRFYGEDVVTPQNQQRARRITIRRNIHSPRSGYDLLYCILLSSQSRKGIKGYKKWVLYRNIRQSYCKLPTLNPALTANLYCQQLEHLKIILREKRPTLTNGDSAKVRPYSAGATQRKLARLDWQLLHHSLHSLEIDPSDFYIFCFLIDNTLKSIKCKQNFVFINRSNLLKTEMLMQTPNKWSNTEYCPIFTLTIRCQN